MPRPRVPILLAAAAAVTLLASACREQGLARISESGFGAYEVSLATFDDRIAVGWYDTRDGNAEIYVRVVDAAGRRAHTEERLTNDAEDSYEIDLAAADDALAVAWYDKDASQRLRSRLGLYEFGTGFTWRTDLSTTGNASRNPVVRARDERIFCAWIEADDDGAEHVLAAWWDTSGRPLGAPVTLAEVGETTWNLNAALDETGRSWVVFDARVETAAEELYVATLDGGRVDLERLSADDGVPSKYPDIAIDAGRTALTWFDERDGNREVYLHAGSLDTLDIELERDARRISHTSGDSIGAYVAWNPPHIGLAWSDRGNAGAHDVMFQRFDASGAPLGPIERITNTPERSLIPAISPWRDGFAIAWNEVSPGPEGTHDPATRSEVELTFRR